MDIATMKYTYISDSCQKNTGYLREEHLLLSVYDVVPKEYVEKSMQLIKNEMSLIINQGKENTGLTLELQRYNKDRSLH